MYKNRRYGKFRIDRKFIESYSETIKQVMGQCIILRAEFMAMHGHIEYQAISDLFDEVSEGDIIPEYRIRMVTEGKNVKWMFEKVD